MGSLNLILSIAAIVIFIVAAVHISRLSDIRGRRAAETSMREWLSVAILALTGAAIVAQVQPLVRQVEVASDTEARQLRAYVFANPNDRPSASAAGVPYIYSVTFGNGGQTPAYHIASTLDAGYAPTNTPIEAVDVKPSAGMEGDYLYGAHTKQYNGPTVTLTKEQSDAIQIGKGGIIFQGKLTYNDVFQCRHYVRFCVFYFSQRGAPAAQYDCPGYNDTDDPTRCDRG